MPCFTYSFAAFSSLVFMGLLFLSPASSSAADITVEGRIFIESGPLAGASVSVYTNYKDIAAGRPLFTSSPVDAQGLYRFQLQPGEYYFTARGNEGNRAFFAYHGGNPIRVGTENIWLTFMANETTSTVYSDGIPAIKGIVTYKGEPVQDAHVAIYTLDANKFKGLGFLAEKGIGFMKAAGRDGTFNFPLAPNEYVVIARKTGGGNEIRPLKKDDLYCYAPQNPIVVKPGRTAQVEVPCYPVGERADFVSSPKIKTNNYLTIDQIKRDITSGIKGKVTDEKGTPLGGIYVIAYRTDNAVKPTSEAENIAETDAGGEFFIRLETAGTYGLVARNTLGGAPRPNDISGLYNKDPWQGLSFTAGKLIEQVHIVIKEDRMPFE